MIRRQACFTCTTPYQVLGAINITKKKHLDADIYIFGMFYGYDQVANRLRKYKVFKRVISVDCSIYYSHLSKKKAFMQMIFSKKIVRSFLDEDIVYDSLYTSSRAHIKQMLQHQLEKRNPQLQIVIYDDGLGTYQKQSSMLNASRLKRVSERILGWKTFSAGRTSMLVNQPSMVELPEKIKNIPVEKIDTIEWSDDSISMLMDVFSVTEEDTIKEKIIIFDTNRDVYINNLGISLNLMDRCYKKVIDVFGYEKVMCKPGPRTKSKCTLHLKSYEKTNVPIEILYAGMTDLETRVLVSNCSTAVFSPKLLFDKEPYIIDLHHLVFEEENETKQIFSSLFDKFSKIYENENKIYAPKSMEELETTLKSINDKCLDIRNWIEL